MSRWTPEAWLSAWYFAADAHGGQLVPGSRRPYIAHVGAVAMEISHAIAQRAELASRSSGAEFGAAVERPELAIQVALLHDVVEDTSITIDQIRARFGDAVADGVAAMSKNPSVGDKPAQMRDSLLRIRAQPPEVWMVKLADRITNLAPPPEHWTAAKIAGYRIEAELILVELGAACPVLGPRLASQIRAYPPG
jgi:(p)ppGpp synthase/HD superfamily hydrolase